MKTTTNIVLDTDIKEAAKVRRFKDPKFSLSNTINEFLRGFFEIDVKTLEEDKVKMEVSELENRLALAKAKIKAIESEEDRQKEEYRKKYGEPHLPDL